MWRAIAAWLCPEMARNEKRYRRLTSEISTVYRWCDGEAADVAQWLTEGDTDYWRPMPMPPTGTLPCEIYNFREYLRGRRKAAA